MTTSCVAMLMREGPTSTSPSTDAEQPRAELGDGMSFIIFHTTPYRACFRPRVFSSCEYSLDDIRNVPSIAYGGEICAYFLRTAPFDTLPTISYRRSFCYSKCSKVMLLLHLQEKQYTLVNPHPIPSFCRTGTTATCNGTRLTAWTATKRTRC